MQPPHQLGLVVGLPDLHLQPERLTGLPEPVDQLVVRGGALDLWFAGAETAQVGTIQDEYAHGWHLIWRARCTQR